MRAVFLAVTRCQRDLLADVQQLALVRRPPVLRRPGLDGGGHPVRNRDRARGVGVHLLLRDALDLVAVAVRARHPRHAELAGQAALGVGRDDGLDRAQDLAQAHGVQRPVLPVPHGLDQPGDLVVDVILRIPVPAGALQPGRHRDQRFLEPARLLAVHPPPVVAGPGHPGPFLHVLQARAVGGLQYLLVLVLNPGPPRRCRLIPGQAGPALVLPDRGMEHRDRLRQRHRHVGVRRRLPGRLRRLPLQLQQPLGCGVRLSRLQPRQVIGELRVIAPRPAQLLPGQRVNLPVNQLVRLALDYLARAEPERLGARAPPPARRLARLGRVDVVAASRPLRLGMPSLVLPDIAEVKAGRGGDDDSHTDLRCA